MKNNSNTIPISQCRVLLAGATGYLGGFVMEELLYQVIQPGLW